MWKTENLFFLRSHQNPEKTVAFFLEDLFFVGEDHIKIGTKLWPFPRLFWSLQHRKSVIFELAPGLRSALGAPVRTFTTLTAQSCMTKRPKDI